MIARTTVVGSWAAALGLWIGVGFWLVANTARSHELERIALPQTTLQLSRSTAPAVTFAAPDAAIAELLGRSPFDEARRQFQRTSIDSGPAPPAVPPRLLGVTSDNGTRSALVEWSPSRETQNLVVGATTPQGVVTRIGDADLVLKSGETETVIRMFDYGG